MKNRAIVPAFVAVSLIYAVCVSNVPAVELLSRMTLKMGKAEAKCGAAVQKSAKQKGESAKKSHRNVLSNLVSQIHKSVASKSGGKAKSSPKQKSAAQKSAKQKSAAQKSAAQKSAKQKSAAQKSAKQKGNHTPLKDLLSQITSAVQPKQKSAAQKSAKKKSAAQKSAKKKSAAQKSAKKKSAAQKSAKKKSAAQKSAKKKSAAQKSAKGGGHVRNLLSRVVRHMEPKCGCEPQGKKASAGKQDDATPPPAPEVSNEA